MDSPLAVGQYFGNIGREHGTDDLKTDPSTFNLYWTIFHKDPIVNEAKAVIPFSTVLDEMRMYAAPFFGEWTETSENVAFLEVKSKFFEFSFWLNHIYVWYDKEGEEFFLLQKVKENDPKDKKFRNLLSEEKEEIIKIEIPEEVIKHTWDGLSNYRFRNWYKFVFEHLFAMKAYHNRTVFYNKVLKRYVVNQMKQGIDLEEERMYTTKPFLDIKGAQGTSTGLLNEITPIEIVNPTDLKAYLDCVYKVFDRKISELGRVANVNHKGARSTVGDNYLDTHAIVCRQQMVLDRLKLLSLKIKNQWGVELNFDLTGGREAVPDKEDTIKNKEQKDPEEKVDGNT